MQLMGAHQLAVVSCVAIGAYSICLCFPTNLFHNMSLFAVSFMLTILNKEDILSNTALLL